MKFKLLKYLFFVVSVLHLSSVTAQSIVGRVVDVQNISIEYATVALYQKSNLELVEGAVTDLTGKFSFIDLEKETYYVEISFMGYQTLKIENLKITNSNTSIDLGEITLKLGNQLDEVLITAETSTLVHKIDRQVVDTDKFKNAIGGSGLDVLNNLPSVSIDSQGEISMRGSTGFVVLLNDKPIQGDAASLIAQIPANAIDRVEIITAPSAKYDPEGKAGILNIITKKGTANGTFGQVNIRGGLPSIETYGNKDFHQRYSMDFTYNLRTERWNLSLGANYQRNDLGGRREGDVFTIIDDIKTQFPSTGERSFDETNFSGRISLDYTPDSSQNISFGLFAGERSKKRLADIVYFDNHAIDLSNPEERLYTFQYFNSNLRERKSDFILGSIDYEKEFENTSKISTSLLYEYTLLGGPTVNQNLGFPDDSILFQDEFNTNDNPLNGIRFQINYSFKPFSIGSLEVGYQFRNLNHTGDFVYQRRISFEDEFELVPEFSSRVDLQRQIHSVYSQLSGKVNKFEYSAGTRLESMQRILDLEDKANTVDETFNYDFVKLFSSASLQYEINSKTKLKAAYSKRIERTTTFKMNPFPEREHSETLEQGDPNLRPEFVDLVEIGVNHQLNNGNTFYLSAYHRNVENLVNRVNTVFNDTILNRIYSNVGKAKVYGVEIGAELKPTKNWSNFIGANIYNYSIDGQFDNRPVNTETLVYSINANSTFKFWKDANLQFTFNYLSDRVTAQGEDSRFYSPGLSFQKAFFDKRLIATLQWQNIDLGLLSTNEQRITTARPNDFFTTTNYIYEVDMVFINLSYIFNNGENKSKFLESEFGKREF